MEKNKKNPDIHHLYDELEKLQQKFKDTEEKFLLLLESTPDIIINIDRNGIIRSINKKFLGKRKQDLTGKLFTDIIPEEEHKKVKAILHRVLSHGISEAYDIYYPEEKKWFSTTLGSIKKNSELIGAILILRDITDKKKEEEEIRIEKEFTENLINTAQVIVLVLDNEGKIVRFNPYLEEISGYKQDEVKGKDWFTTFIPEGDKNRIRNVFNRSVSGQNIKGNTNPIICKNGQERIIEWYDSTLRDNSGNVIGVLATGQDITKRKMAEEALLKSEHRLADAMKIAKLGYWEFDVGKNLFIFDDRFYELYGTTAEAVGGYAMQVERYGEIFLYPEDLSLLKKEIHKAIKTKNPEFRGNFEHRIKLTDDRIRFFSVFYYIMKDENGNTIKIYGASQDITERKMAEEALRTSEAQLVNAMKIARLGHWEYDVLKDIFIFTDQFYSIFGTTAEKMGGYIMTPEKYAQTFIHPDDRLVVALEIELVLASDDPNFSRQLEHRIIYANGETGYISVRYFVVKDQYGRTIKTYGANQDITERKLAEKQLKKQNKRYQKLNDKLKESLNKVKKMNKELEKARLKAEESDRLKSAFLTNMSHEIRTPMNGIIGFSKMLNKQGLSDDKRKQYTGIINEMSRQLLHLIDDIISISKIETGQVRIHKTKTNINDILIRMFSFYSPLTNRNKVNLYMQKSLPDEKAEIYTDYTKLSQVLDNLISNAMKFTSEGYIKYGYHFNNDFLQFFVEDTGIGIAEDLQETIFERFRQAEYGDSRLYGGTGLGLAISKAFVQKMGGEIGVNSQLNKGSVFYFTIPYEPVNPQLKEDLVNTSYKPVILIVEDEEYNYLYLEELLLGFNNEILHAKNGSEAIEMCRNDLSIDFVLLDIKLPDMSGYDVIKKIKTFRSDLPVIAQTAYALSGDREKALDAGCVDYISKPIDEKELLQKIEHYSRLLADRRRF